MKIVRAGRSPSVWNDLFHISSSPVGKMLLHEALSWRARSKTYLKDLLSSSPCLLLAEVNVWASATHAKVRGYL
ncbi:hypothetical protein MUK42_19816 [Musa troglodytarum]|uniref:Uncharacterized protein n=1 Tax=Musa troglodytarum TaxID=320322 RepID=A0A9E7JZ99_9LILI|nr:hypothetical protein MUK42_19816 [Musa troglodytarum]